MSSAPTRSAPPAPAQRAGKKGSAHASRRTALGFGVLVVALLVGAVLVSQLAGGAPTGSPQGEAGRSGGGGARSTSPASPGGAQAWLSGAAGPGAVDGSFAEWRDAPVDIVGTWVDTNEAMVHLWQLQPGEELGDWAGPLDVAVGAIGPDESWREAAAGAYDDRWRASLRGLRDLREDADGTTYVRFAHESNGDWYPWSVDAGSAEDFVEAWKRFRALQQEEFPESELVFNVNRESVGSGIDWRETFPGSEHVDVFSVDYYNQHPWVNSEDDWTASIEEVDRYGAPKGLLRHLEFAREVGLPFAVSEWSNNADIGDAPVFMEQMHAFFQEHAGSGPGELLYEVHFNIDQDDNSWALHPETRMPESAEVYRRLW